jgi:hypothetical protein
LVEVSFVEVIGMAVVNNSYLATTRTVNMSMASAMDGVGFAGERCGRKEVSLEFRLAD